MRRGLDLLQQLCYPLWGAGTHVQSNQKIAAYRAGAHSQALLTHQVLLTRTQQGWKLRAIPDVNGTWSASLRDHVLHLSTEQHQQIMAKHVSHSHLL